MAILYKKYVNLKKTASLRNVILTCTFGLLTATAGN